MKRWYVAEKNPKTNTIIAAPEGHPLLYRKEITIKNVHWINQDEINNMFFWSERRNINNKLLRVNKSSDGVGGWGASGGTKSGHILARIRQVGELLPAKLIREKNKYKVILDKTITGISQGQAVVLYHGEKCLGGGEIKFEKD